MPILWIYFDHQNKTCLSHVMFSFTFQEWHVWLPVKNNMFDIFAWTGHCWYLHNLTLTWIASPLALESRLWLYESLCSRSTFETLTWMASLLALENVPWRYEFSGSRGTFETYLFILLALHETSSAFWTLILAMMAVALWHRQVAAAGVLLNKRAEAQVRHSVLTPKQECRTCLDVALP